MASGNIQVWQQSNARLCSDVMLEYNSPYNRLAVFMSDYLVLDEGDSQGSSTRLSNHQKGIAEHE